MKRTVIVGVSGGIAAYKSCELVSRLKKLGYTVKVVMTKNATEFVTPLTFETLSGYPVALKMFEDKPRYDVEHISLAKEGALYVIAPATANVIAKVANGIADDMLTTTFMASEGVRVICPAMNTAMYEDEATRENLVRLAERGIEIIEPDVGQLACGDIGKGRMAEAEQIARLIDERLTPNPDFRGKRVLITAGATEESIDGVRFISNRSSGKMGVAIANAVLMRGGEVTLVHGRMTVPLPLGVTGVAVKTTAEMYDAVLAEMGGADVVIKAAAPADYRVITPTDNKIKSERLTLEFVKNPDIAAEVGRRKGEKILVAFAAETQALLKNASEKLRNKNADLIVANDVTKENAGFDVDTNIATLLYADGRIEALPLMDKTALAHVILDGILSL